MRQDSSTRLQALPLGTLVSIAIALLAETALPAFGDPGPRAGSSATVTRTNDSAPLLAVEAHEAPPRAGAAAESPRSALTLADPPAPRQLVQPEDLARLLADTTARRPAVLHVGFKVLFRSGHIPGSRYIGPASKPEGLAALKKALRKIPREKAVVLYCGCCPWTDCPNVNPAFRAAREMRFNDVRVLYIAKNLQDDWIDKGLPVSEGDQ